MYLEVLGRLIGSFMVVWWKQNYSFVHYQKPRSSFSRSIASLICSFCGKSHFRLAFLFLFPTAHRATVFISLKTWYYIVGTSGASPNHLLAHYGMKSKCKGQLLFFHIINTILKKNFINIYLSNVTVIILYLVSNLIKFF